MKKIVWFMHISLDGFVAGPNGEMDWITVDEELFDYVGDHTNTSDMALYGRVTWQMMEAYWPTAGNQPNASKHDIEHSAWYSQVQKVVLSNSKQGESQPLTTFLGENFAEEISSLKQGDGKDIIIFGSPSAGQSLLKEGLVDELWLFVNPVLVGKGIPMFPALEERMKLHLLEYTKFNNGVICLNYEVKK